MGSCSKISFMKLLNVWIWESLENLPMIIGFVIGSRLWEESIPFGLIALITGMGLGVLVTRALEPKLHPEKHEVRWVSVVLNFFLFVGLAVPFVYYFRADTSLINWKTDLLGGMAAGLLLTIVQSTHWSGPKSRMLLHGAAMMTAFPIIMLGLRNIIRIKVWGFSILLTLLLTLFASFLIALIDYREMYRKIGDE